MSGSHHTGRRPTRLSSITKRDSRATGDRRRVAEADIRSAIYVRPLGTAYDVVKNVCNDQEYVVANATGSTHTAGQVVPLGSFTGNPGEFTFGRPPAGYGGASSYSIRTALEASPIATAASGEQLALYRLYSAWYDASSSRYVVSGFEAESEQWEGPYDPCFVLFSQGDIGPMTLGDWSGSMYYRMTLAESGVSSSIPVCLFVNSSGVTYATFQIPRTPTSSGLEWFRYYKISNAGDVVETIEYERSQSGSHMYAQEGHGSSLICIEPDEDTGSSGSPPFKNYRRVVLRNSLTLAEQAEYDFPSVSPFNGSAARVQTPLAVYRKGGGDYAVLFYNVDTSFNITWWWRALSGSLTFVSDTQIDGTTWGDALIGPEAYLHGQFANNSVYTRSYDPDNGFADSLVAIPFDGSTPTVLTEWPVSGNEYATLRASGEFAVLRRRYIWGDGTPGEAESESDTLISLLSAAGEQLP